MAEFIKKGLSNDNPHVSEFFSGVEIERNRSAPPWERGRPARPNCGQDGRAPRKRQGGLNGYN